VSAGRGANPAGAQIDGLIRNGGWRAGEPGEVAFQVARPVRTGGRATSTGERTRVRAKGPLEASTSPDLSIAWASSS
jgi:hypothetical protein